MANPVDLSVYLIVGPSHVAGDMTDLVRRAALGGVSLVQLRDKQSATGAMVESARALKAALAGTGVPLVINDRADVMLAAEADGLHVGLSDLTPADARRLIGRDRILGITVKRESEACAVDPDLIDYASIGGVFETVSKTNPDPPVGLDGLARMAGVLQEVAPHLPRCAIAGIDAGNAARVVAAGVDGVAVVRAITQAEDPRAAADALAGIVTATRQQRRIDA